MKKLLFICSQNKLRSPTAEVVFNAYDQFETASAGLNDDATISLSPELLKWADVIFVMEQVHRARLLRKFKPHLKGKKVVCLNIPDQYDYMDPVLVQILQKKVLPLFGKSLD